MKSPVCLGDVTSSGGEVVDCQHAGTHIANGRTAAVIGDRATCPLHGGTFEFIEGHPSRLMRGKRVVLEGHKLACGCHAIAGAASFIGVR
jgi:uncharacterized Zn-binding protein involved in type VI secretion